MRKLLVTSLLLPLACASFAQAELETQDQKNSYSLGYQVGSGLGQDLSRQGISVDLKSLIDGLKTGFEGKASQLSQEEMDAAMMDLQAQAQAGRQKMLSELSAKNLEAGKAFLEANRKKEGVKVTDSGLQYRVIEEGEGKTPGPENRVSVHYRGTLIDGTPFDSSYDRGQPATFPVGGVIAGWTEALQLMKEGAKYELVIPSELAYGERGAGQEIGPNATLVFEVELLSIL